jgi:hypothetical protein
MGRKASTGSCYQSAANLLFEARFTDMRLAHGTCTGHQEIAGVAFGHAWVETEDLVFDRDNVFRKDLYYRVGACRSVHLYTIEKARRMLLRHRHYGPWHEDNEPVAFAPASKKRMSFSKGRRQTA